MSYLTALVGMWCPSVEDLYTPEELARMRKLQEEEEERKKHYILNKEHFASIARPEESTVGGASGVKILRDKDGVLHFMNTKTFPFHYQYCTTFCNEKRPLEIFNDEAYTGKDRSMMFATIMCYATDKTYNNTYCIELNPADPMVPGLEQIDEFFAQVKKAFMPSIDAPPVLFFHPTSPSQIEATKSRKLSLPVIKSSEIFGNIPYKSVVSGRIKNKLVSIFDKETYTEEELVNWLNLRTTEEIVVIPSIPNDLPAVGGVICNEIIPPLCHVALLCQNRNSPCCYFKDATKQLHKVFGQIVNGVISRSGFCLDGRNKPVRAEADKVEPVQIEAADTYISQLIELDSLRAANSRIVGAKATQLAKVDAIRRQPVFEGTFIVPFHYYDKHLNANQALKERLKSLLTKIGTVNAYGRSAEAIQNNVFDYNQFTSIMDQIEQAPIDSELVRHVIDKIVQNKWTSVILRSSTNAEDLAGFNGAGLYESIALFGEDVSNHEKVSQALKAIWASVWSPKAVKERQHYQIPHNQVMMAVLVQPCISDKMTDVKVLMNGVCITHDASRHGVKNGFVVQVFPGSEYQVTNHYKDATPESVTLLLGRQKDSVDMLLNSLCNKNTGPLLTQSDAVNMTEVFGKLHNRLLGSPHSLNSTTALDIEFMIVNNKATNIDRELVVLQARPYKVNVFAADCEQELRRMFTGFYTLQTGYYYFIYS